MVARYADVMVNRGGLPLYQLPVAQPEVEETLPSDYQVAAVDCSVLPLLPLHLQAVLAKPPLCQSTNLKDDLHLRNLRFFVDQTQFNIRHQKDLKLRGGFIEAGDMERIVNYMDEESTSRRAGTSQRRGRCRRMRSWGPAMGHRPSRGRKSASCSPSAASASARRCEGCRGTFCETTRAPMGQSAQTGGRPPGSCRRAWTWLWTKGSMTNVLGWTMPSSAASEPLWR
ncbi:unnamed protein product [Effrenium voratum]|uniref:Uncharacterized protein n=1 Tax=Effrenium voratum TaxID=2562239 RepID=A0AA36IGP3_9DINO|nr:unnamed protein product [Effrenium voratum]